MSFRSSRWQAFAGMLIAALFTAGAAQAEAPPAQAPQAHAPSAQDVDPRALAVVKRMSHDMGAMSSFRVTGDTSMEVVLKSGEKRAFEATSYVSVKRPNKLRGDRRGERADVSAYYDGKRFTVYGRRANMYATTPAPPTLNETIGFAEDKLHMDFPGADLLDSDPYRVLTENIESAEYVDEAMVDGVVCDHVAFRGPDVDFQLWVDKGPRALPRRYVIVSKREPQAPEFTVSFHDWRPNARLSDALFDFVPPAGAVRIDFLPESRSGRVGTRAGEGGER